MCIRDRPCSSTPHIHQQVSDLAIRAGGPSQLALAPNTGTNLIWIGLAASALVIVVLLLAIAGLSRRRKRQRRTGALS